MTPLTWRPALAEIRLTSLLMTRQRKRANLSTARMICDLCDEMMMKCHSPGNVEVPLGSEQPHVHLHLGVEVAHAPGLLLLELLGGVLLHLADRVQEEQYQYRHQHVEIVYQLVLQAL